MLELILQAILEDRCCHFCFRGRETEAQRLTVSTVEVAHHNHAAYNLRAKLPRPVHLGQCGEGKPSGPEMLRLDTHASAAVGWTGDPPALFL